MKEYFSHDYGSRRDPKTLRLLRVGGMCQYGLFWSILEYMYEQGGSFPETDIPDIAYDCRIDEDSVMSVLNDYELFFLEDGIYKSHSVNRRLQERETKSTKASASAKSRWDKLKNQVVDANAMRTQCERNAIKGKKSKVKKIEERPDANELIFQDQVEKNEPTKKLEVAVGVFLTQKESDDLIAKYGLKDAMWMVEKLSAYKESKGAKYKSDAGAIRSWVIKEWEKQRGTQTVSIKAPEMNIDYIKKHLK